MTIMNSGIVVLNGHDLQADQACVFCILGLPGGGTTMTSRLLERAGVFMGENMPFNAEDPAFSSLLKEQRPSSSAFDELVSRRNQQYRRWGFKAPFRYHWDLLSSIDNVRFVVVFRDILAVTNRTTISSGVNSLAGLSSNVALLRRITDFLSASVRPQLLFSYEKALIAPDQVSESVLNFCGSQSSPDLIHELVTIIQPNERTYVMGQHALSTGATGHIDVVGDGRIAGWVRRPGNIPLSVQIDVDGVTVAKGVANKARADLARAFGGEGRFGFDFTFDSRQAASPRRELLVRNSESGAIILSKKFIRT